MPLPQTFASLFGGPAARARLATLPAAGHVALPTFNLTTTSLRHLPKWLERLRDIANGVTSTHGNFYSDPAALGLVDSNARPRVLTPAGNAFLAKRASIGTSPERGEYELLKILYFSGYAHTPNVQLFLDGKRQNMLDVLSQFSPAPIRSLFVARPSLLVIAELVVTFPGAIQRLLQLSEADLIALINLGEAGFRTLCTGHAFATGLNRLCRRIGSDYTRGEERRLHYVVSMALLSIAQTIPHGAAIPLKVPMPYSNLLTELDIFDTYARYTSDLTVWFDGVLFQVSSSLTPAPPPAPLPLPPLAVQLATGLPGGTGGAQPTDPHRNRRRSPRHATISVVLDPVLSSRAEDAVEALLTPQHGAFLVRVGHRAGETLALPDGMVPGADFYVVDAAGQPTQFIEVKSITGNPPVLVNLTRAEYLRAVRCAANGIPYRLYLVDVRTWRCHEAPHFATQIAAATLEHVRQFVVSIG